MATGSPKKNYDRDKVNEINTKLADTPKIAELVGGVPAFTNNVSAY